MSVLRRRFLLALVVLCAGLLAAAFTPQGTASARDPGVVWLAAFDSYVQTAAGVRNRLLARVTQPLKEAKANNDREQEGRLTAERDALNSLGSWPASVKVPDQLSLLKKAQTDCLEAYADAATKLRQGEHSDQAEEMKAAKEIFVRTNYLAASEELVNAKSPSTPFGWTRNESGVLVSSLRSAEQKPTSLQLVASVQQAFLLDLTLERLEGNGGVVLGFPDMNGGWLDLSVGCPSNDGKGPGPKSVGTGLFEKGRARILVYCSREHLTVMGNGCPLLPGKGGWAEASASRESSTGGASIVIRPSDGQTAIAVHRASLRPLVPLAEDFFRVETEETKGQKVKADVAAVDSDLVDGSKWTGQLILDGEAFPCDVKVDSRSEETITLNVVAARMKMTWSASIKKSIIKVTGVTVHSDNLYDVDRNFSAPQITGSVKNKKVMLKGNWHQDHPRAGTGTRDVKLEISLVK